MEWWPQIRALAPAEAGQVPQTHGLRHHRLGTPARDGHVNGCCRLAGHAVRSGQFGSPDSTQAGT